MKKNRFILVSFVLFSTCYPATIFDLSDAMSESDINNLVPLTIKDVIYEPNIFSMSVSTRYFDEDVVFNYLDTLFIGKDDSSEEVITFISNVVIPGGDGGNSGEGESRERRSAGNIANMVMGNVMAATFFVLFDAAPAWEMASAMKAMNISISMIRQMGVKAVVKNLKMIQKANPSIATKIMNKLKNNASQAFKFLKRTSLVKLGLKSANEIAEEVAENSLKTAMKKETKSLLNQSLKRLGQNAKGIKQKEQLRLADIMETADPSEMFQYRNSLSKRLSVIDSSAYENFSANVDSLYKQTQNLSFLGVDLADALDNPILNAGRQKLLDKTVSTGWKIALRSAIRSQKSANSDDFFGGGGGGGGFGQRIRSNHELYGKGGEGFKPDSLLISGNGGDGYLAGGGGGGGSCPEFVGAPWIWHKAGNGGCGGYMVGGGGGGSPGCGQSLSDLMEQNGHGGHGSDGGGRNPLVPFSFSGAGGAGGVRFATFWDSMILEILFGISSLIPIVGPFVSIALKCSYYAYLGIDTGRSGSDALGSRGGAGAEFNYVFRMATKKLAAQDEVPDEPSVLYAMGGYGQSSLAGGDGVKTGDGVSFKKKTLAGLPGASGGGIGGKGGDCLQDYLGAGGGAGGGGLNGEGGKTYDLSDDGRYSVFGGGGSGGSGGLKNSPSYNFYALSGGDGGKGFTGGGGGTAGGFLFVRKNKTLNLGFDKTEMMTADLAAFSSRLDNLPNQFCGLKILAGSAGQSGNNKTKNVGYGGGVVLVEGILNLNPYYSMIFEKTTTSTASNATGVATTATRIKNTNVFNQSLPLDGGYVYVRDGGRFNIHTQSKFYGDVNVGVNSALYIFSEFFGDNHPTLDQITHLYVDGTTPAEGQTAASVYLGVSNLKFTYGSSADLNCFYCLKALVQDSMKKFPVKTWNILSPGSENQTMILSSGPSNITTINVLSNDSSNGYLSLEGINTWGSVTINVKKGGTLYVPKSVKVEDLSNKTITVESGGILLVDSDAADAVLAKITNNGTKKIKTIDVVYKNDPGAPSDGYLNLEGVGNWNVDSITVNSGAILYIPKSVKVADLSNKTIKVESGGILLVDSDTADAVLAKITNNGAGNVYISGSTEANNVIQNRNNTTTIDIAHKNVSGDFLAPVYVGDYHNGYLSLDGVGKWARLTINVKSGGTLHVPKSVNVADLSNKTITVQSGGILLVDSDTADAVLAKITNNGTKSIKSSTTSSSTTLTNSLVDDTYTSNTVIEDTVNGFSVMSNATKWVIANFSMNITSLGMKGQTLQNLPDNIKTIVIEKGASLYITGGYYPTWTGTKKLTVDGSLYVVGGGIFDDSKFEIDEGSKGKIIVLTSSGLSLNPRKTDLGLPRFTLGYNLDFYSDDNLMDDSSQVGKIPESGNWYIRGDNQTASSFIGKSIHVFGNLYVRRDSDIGCECPIYVEPSGLFIIESLMRKLTSLTVQSFGELNIRSDFSIKQPVSIENSGQLTLSSTALITKPEGSTQKIEMRSGSILDMDVRNWIYQDVLSIESPITIITRNIVTDTADGLAFLGGNRWIVGNDNQTFDNVPSSVISIGFADGVNLKKPYVINSGGKFKFKKGAKVSNIITVNPNGLLILDAYNLSDYKTTYTQSTTNGNRTSTWRFYEDSTLSILSEDGLEENSIWTDFKNIKFSFNAQLLTFVRFIDDADHVGAISCIWKILALNQTAKNNTKKINKITIANSGSLVSNEQKSFRLYSGQTLSLDDPTKKITTDPVVNFDMQSGTTIFEQGSIIEGATDTNVSVGSVATVEIGSKFLNSSGIKMAWFKDGSTLSTTGVFIDDDKIKSSVIWKIKSKNNPRTTSKFQTAYNACSTVNKIILDDNSFLGVENGKQFSLTNNLVMNAGSRIEVLPGGDFEFSGGTLTKDSTSSIFVNRGASVTISSSNYTLKQILNMVQFDYGSIIYVGDGNSIYELPDDITGVGAVPEGVKIIFRNGIQNISVLNPQSYGAEFDQNGILEVNPDAPLTLLSGQSLDLHEDTISGNKPYRLMIRSNSKVIANAGAEIKEYTNSYTVLGSKGPIVLQTDAKTMDDIPGSKRWITAAQSTYLANKRPAVNSSNPYFDGLNSNGVHSDMNEFETSNGYFNAGSDLQLQTTDTFEDSQSAMGKLPFKTWNVASTQKNYTVGQTISELPSAATLTATSFSEDDFKQSAMMLGTINVVDGAYLYSFPNRDMKIGQYLLKSGSNFVKTDRTLKIQKGGTLYIVLGSNATVGNLYVESGANLVVYGRLNVTSKMTIEDGANITLNGEILYNSSTYSSTNPLLKSTSSSAAITYDQTLKGVERALDNPDNKKIKIDENTTLTLSGSCKNNEGSLIDVFGTLNLPSASTLKNLGVVRINKGGMLQTDASYFKNDDVRFSWLRSGATFQTISNFEDGYGAISSIPADVTWIINADQTTNASSFTSNNVVVKKTLTTNQNFTVLAGQTLKIEGRLTAKGTFTVLSGGILDLSAANAIDVASNILVENGGRLITGTTVSDKVTLKDGSIIQNASVWSSIPSFNKSANTDAIQWYVGVGSQDVSSFGAFSLIKVLSGITATCSMSTIHAGKRLVLDDGSTITITYNGLNVSGLLDVSKTAVINGSIILQQGASFKSDRTSLHNVTFNALITLIVDGSSVTDSYKNLRSGSTFAVGKN